MRKLFVLAVVSVLIHLDSPVWALNRQAGHGKEMVKLEEMVVTSTSKTKMLDTPASITIITARDLQRMGAKNITEALKRVPGVIDRSSSNQTQCIRGTFSSMAGGPVLLVDGVPRKTGTARYNEYNMIPVSQIERIEVLKSPGISYGPGAARGVINVITKKSEADQPVQFDTRLSYGSWDTHNEYAAFYGKKGKWDYFLDGSNFHTDGYEEETQARVGVLGKLGFHLSGETRIGLRTDFTSSDADRAHGFAKYDYQLKNYRRSIHFPKSATNSKLIWHNEKDQDNASIGVELSHKSDKRFFDSSVTYADYDEQWRYHYKKITSPASIYTDDKDQKTYHFKISGGLHIDFGSVHYTPSLGINYENIDFSVRRTYPNNPAKNTDEFDVDGEETQYGIFWDNDFLAGDRWGLKIGGRLDQANMAVSTQEPVRVDEDHTMFSWQISPSYKFSEKSNLYASVARSYWYPVPSYWIKSAQDGGTLNRPEDLKPEESTSYELGYKHLLNKAFNFSLVGFITTFDDKLSSMYDAADKYIGQKNVGEAEYKGVEFEANGRLSPWLGYRIAGTYLETEWTQGRASVKTHPANTGCVMDLDGYEMYGLPNLTYTVGVDLYPVDGIRCSIDANHTGAYFIDYINRLEYEEKTTVDANISYTTGSWEIWLLGKNVFDEQIERAVNSKGTLTSANGDPKTYYYVQDGQYFEIGLSYHY